MFLYKICLFSQNVLSVLIKYLSGSFSVESTVDFLILLIFIVRLNFCQSGISLPVLNSIDYSYKHMYNLILFVRMSVNFLHDNFIDFRLFSVSKGVNCWSYFLASAWSYFPNPNFTHGHKWMQQPAFPLKWIPSSSQKCDHFENNTRLCNSFFCSKRDLVQNACSWVVQKLSFQLFVAKACFCVRGKICIFFHYMQSAYFCL